MKNTGEPLTTQWCIQWNVYLSDNVWTRHLVKSLWLTNQLGISDRDLQLWQQQIANLRPKVVRARDLWSDCTTFCEEILSLWESEIYRTSITRNAFSFIAVRSSDTELWPVQTYRVHKLSNPKTSRLSNGLGNTWGRESNYFFPSQERLIGIIQPLSEKYGYDRLSD